MMEVPERSRRSPRYQTFFAELKRRRVFRVAAVYGAVGFVVLQAVELLVPMLLLPEWAYRLVGVLLFAGFPIALVLAWAFQVTPEGVKRTDPASAAELEAIVAQPPAKRWPAGILALAGTALLLAGGWWFLRPGDAERAAAPGAAADRPATSPDRPGAAERPSIAVLPFANLSGDDETRPFTDGIHDDLLTQLSKIRELRVISRTSVQEYRTTTRNVRQIARELGVGHVLEGGVQRAGDQVRINVQLIDARADEHLWAERYNRTLTVANIFAIQSEIAQAIADALEARLTTEERESIAALPTENLEAYDFYLLGKDYLFGGYTEGELRGGEQTYARAVELDPEFALAWAELSVAHSLLYWFHHDRSAERARSALETAQRALELDPELPEGHRALAHYFYRIPLDYARALEEVGIAERAQPGSAEVHLLTGDILRRAGEVEKALERYLRGQELDPRSTAAAVSVGETLLLLRRYDEAAPWIRRAADLKPSSEIAHLWLTYLPVRADGDTKAALLAAQRGVELGAIVQYRGLFPWLAYLDRDVERALASLAVSPDPVWKGQFEYKPRALAYAEAYALAGDGPRARAYYDSARVALESLIASDPEDPRYHGALGIAYAGLGRAEEAIREGELAAELMPVEKEAWRGSFRLGQLARIYGMVGRPGEAIDILERLLSIPGDLSVAMLRLDPAWDPLRDDPRFQQLIRRAASDP
ncbi:MAG: tetratricopeptide repeat protein [Gemmatimonadota bacterium]